MTEPLPKEKLQLLIDMRDDLDADIKTLVKLKKLLDECLDAEVINGDRIHEYSKKFEKIKQKLKATEIFVY